MGLQAVLNLPDDVDFGVCPVKSKNVKTILTQNVGTALAKFTLRCSPPAFEAFPAEGLVEPGQTVMVEVHFIPQHATACEGELVVAYEDGDSVFVNLRGVSENVGVFLSTPAVQLDAAYISLSSQKSIKVQNRSEIPVKFSWKQFANDEEEEFERERLFADLAAMEELEENALENDFDQQREFGDASSAADGEQTNDKSGGMAAGYRGGSNDNDGDDDEELSGDEAAVPRPLREARAALSRKYRHLRKALEEDQMGFNDASFEVKPASGEIWANSEVEVTITFRPDTAADYACCGYLDVVGRDERLSLMLKGVGIGPKAVLSYDVLDVGDVFVNSTYAYALSVSNRGDIPCTWRMPPSQTPFGSACFTWEPTKGVLPVGGSQPLGVTFKSGILGEFNETFKVQLKGSTEQLACQMKGHVIGPTFKFDVDVMDFGLVSYGFAHTKTMVITNTSDIAMEFALAIPQDGAFTGKPEFTVEPSGGALEPGAALPITITLVSLSVKPYDYFLTVDVAGVGAGLLSVPVLAECQVPTVEVGTKEIDFGECFVRYPYDQELTLVNASPDLRGKFQVVAQEDATKVVAEFVAEPPSGEIPAGGVTKVRIRLVCMKLGQFRLPVFATVAGSVLPPLAYTLTAFVRGPKVAVDPADVIHWGNTGCLFDAPRPLVLTNQSSIPAPFKAFIKNARSKYRLDVREGVLAPRETATLTVTANLDDTIVHRDSLHLIVEEGDNFELPLLAKGIGTTLFCHDDLAEVSFGPRFTAHQFERKITLENKGRRAQSIKWFNQTAQDYQQAFAAAEKKKAIEEAQAKKKGAEGGAKKAAGGGSKAAKAAEAEAYAEAQAKLVPVFSVFPAEVELRPRTACTFTFRGYTTRNGTVQETLVCESRVGKEKAAKVVYKTVVSANFTNPLLDFTTPEGGLDYTYVWRQEDDEATNDDGGNSNDNSHLQQTQMLGLTNRTTLPLSFLLKASAPFYLDRADWLLEPGETCTVAVNFDPTFRGTRESESVESKLTVVYSDHPQRDTVAVRASIHYPNLNFETRVVNFGSVLNDTTKTLAVRVKNVSTVPCDFAWSFVEDSEAAKAGATTKRPYVAVNQVFDILPIRGQLLPGEEEDIEFVYYGHAHRKFKGSALCEVVGGPGYELALLGEASTVGFKLDVGLLDFGKVLYAQQATKEFYIHNTTKVAFSYGVVALSEEGPSGRPNVVTVAPAQGTVNANDKQKVVVRFRPGLPERLLVRLQVTCAHFEPVVLPVYGEGIFPGIAISLPRDASRQLSWTAPHEELEPNSEEEEEGEEEESKAPGDAASSEGTALASMTMATATVPHSNTLQLVAEGYDSNDDDSLGDLGSPGYRTNGGGGGQADGSSGLRGTTSHGGRPISKRAALKRLRQQQPFGRPTTWPETLEQAKLTLAQPDLSRTPPGAVELYPPAPSALSATYGANANGGLDTQRTGRQSTVRGSARSRMDSGRRPSVRGGNGGPSARSQSTSRSSMKGKPGASGAGAAAAPVADQDSMIEHEANRLVLCDYLLGKYAGREMPPPPKEPTTPAEDEDDNLSYDPEAGLGLDDGDFAAEQALDVTPKVPKLQLTARDGDGPMRASMVPGNTIAAQGGDVTTATATKPPPAPAAATTTTGGKGAAATKKKASERGKPKEWVVAWHECDFGNVVRGVTRKRVFKITNTSAQGALSWQFDSHVLDGSGFSLDPLKVVRLAEGESLQFEVIFFAHKDLPLGPTEVLLSLDLKGGPSLVVAFKAKVTVPEVRLTVDKLSFGDVWVGCARTAYFMVHNTSPVRAEWDVKGSVPASKDEARFTLTPRTGSLAPGERCRVAVEFVPLDGQTSAVRLPLKVAQSRKTRYLSLSGRGVATRLTFSPPLLELGPILPYAPEGATSYVTLVNHSDRAVEVYSLDFDAKYADEEGCLRYMPGYGSDDLLRLPVRQPGDPLAPYVLEEHAKGLALEAQEVQRLAKQQHQLEAASAVAAAGDAAVADLTMGSGGTVAFANFDKSVLGGGASLVAADPAADDLALPTPRWNRMETARAKGQALDTIVVGPPQGGASSMASGLAKAYGYALRTVDALVDEVASSDCGVGFELRVALERLNASDASLLRDKIQALEAVVEGEGSGEEPSAAAKELAKLKGLAQPKVALPEEDSAAAAGGDGSGEGNEAGATGESPSSEPSEPQTLISRELLEAAVKWRLARTDMGRGLVIDSFASTYLPNPLVVANALARALPSATLAAVGFRNRAAYSRRLASLFEDAQDVLDRLRDDTTVPTEVFLSAKDWAARMAQEEEEAAQAAEAAAAAEAERLAAIAERKARKTGGGSRPSSTLAATRGGGAAAAAGGGSGGGGSSDEFSGPFVELSNFEVNMLTEEGQVRYYAARRQHYRNVVEAARLAQQKVAKVWSPVAGLLPRSGKVPSALLGGDDEGEAGAEGGAEGAAVEAIEEVDDEESFDEEAEDPPEPELQEGEVREAKTPYWAFVDLLVQAKSAFGDVCAPDPIINVEQSGKASTELDAATTPDGGVAAPGGDEAAPMLKPRQVGLVVDAYSEAPESLEAALRKLPASQLPLPSEDDVPEPRTQQLIRRPQLRAPREPQRLFEILGGRLNPPAPEAELPLALAQAGENDGDGEGNEDGANAAAVAAADETAEGATDGEMAAASDPNALGETRHRWVVPPHGSVEFSVRFLSKQVGKFNGSLGFEVLGLPGRESQLLVSGTCEVPTINDDPRNVFMHRVKSRPLTAPPVSKRFVMNRGVYEFGPLLTWKDPINMEVPEGALELAAPENWATAASTTKTLALLPEVDGVREAASLYASTWRTNADIFRVSNNGHFETTVRFDFEKSRNPSDVSTRDPATDVFFVSPRDAVLKPDETCDVTVWSFPASPEEVHEDNLVVCASSNPHPTLFPVSCVGAVPKVALHGPWEQDALGVQLSPSALALKAAEEAGVLDGGEVDPEGRPAAVIDFDRLLLGKAEDREFVVTNTSKVALQWKLDLSDFGANLDDEFEVRPTEGRLQMGEQAMVKVFFATGNTEAVYDFAINVNFTDIEAGSDWELAESPETTAGRVNQASLRLTAEAYAIKAVAFEDEEGGKSSGALDFGNMRAGDAKTETFALTNQGKYPIVFHLAVRKAAVAELFTVEPSEGTIEAGATQSVAVTFCSIREVLLRDNKDLRCTVSEPLTAAPFEHFSVSMSARSHWSRFKLQPSRGLTFGAVKFNDTPRPRLFQIKNEGTFAFAYAVKDTLKEGGDDEADAVVRSATPRALLTEEDLALLPEGSADGSDAPALPPLPPPAPKDVGDGGRFNLSTWCGAVEPGQTITVDVTFDPSGEPANHRAPLAVLVSGADPTGDSAVATALSFELVGETAHPAINTKDLRSVFEEQSVVPSLAEAIASRAISDPHGAVASIKPCYAESEKLFTFGCVLTSSVVLKGVVERFKISNPNKIPCTVKFALSAAEAQAGKGSSSGGAADVEAFALASDFGESAEIAAHDFVYVPVSFRPTELRDYRARFTATVADGEATPAMAELTFDIGGRGALPCVTVAAPLTKTEAGEAALDFGRCHVGLRRRRKLTIVNDGIVPATALFERPVEVVMKAPAASGNEKAGGDDAAGSSENLPRSGRPGGAMLTASSSSPFGCSASGTSITLQPGQRQSFHATLEPPESGLRALASLGPGEAAAVAATVRMTVMHNPFEATTFKLFGECYANDVLIEDLPTDEDGPQQLGNSSSSSSGGDDGVGDDQQGAENSLNFGEYDLERLAGEPKLATFTMRNRTADPVKYVWADAAPFEITPKVGHLAAGASKQVTASFAASAEARCDAIPAALTTTRIKYGSPEDGDEDSSNGGGHGHAAPAVANWVEGMTVTRRATDEEREAHAEAVKNGGSSGKTLEVFMERGFPSVHAPVPEPPHEPSAPPTTQNLLCSAVADTARYECDTTNVSFAPTAMFQRRVYSFEVSNPGGVALPFRFKLEDAVKPGSALAATRMALAHTPGTAPGSGTLIPCPFSVEPAEGTVPARGNVKVTVRFAPEEVDNFAYTLEARMPTLPSSTPPLSVLLRGSATRPVAHVDLADGASDYLATRAPGLKNDRGAIAPLEATSVRVAQLTSRGLRVRNTQRFCVHNPTAASYDFTWEPCGEPDPSWRCATPKGTVVSGKKGEMVFEYTPDAVGLAEAFFKLCIPAHGLEELFLFAGNVVEPEVALDRTRVDFGALMVGTVATERVHFENREHLPFSFAFDRATLNGADGARGGGGRNGGGRSRPVLEVSPMSGLVPPNGRVPVDVTFCPSEEVFQNFNLVANVRRKPVSLGLNVKGEGYAVHAKLSVADLSAAAAAAGTSTARNASSAADGGNGGDGGAAALAVAASPRADNADAIELLPKPAANVIDFGQMYLNEARTKTVVVANQGRFNFDYLWTRNSAAAALGPMLEVRGRQLGGTCRKGSRIELSWWFRPVNTHVNLDGCEFMCTIAGKQEYIVKLRGEGLKPALAFSFHSYDFGSCFITPPGAPPLEVEHVLRVTNQDPNGNNLSLDCTFEATRALSVACPPSVLEPGGVVDVPIKFVPRDPQPYAFTVPFLVNGASVVNVMVAGTGIPARLELANPSLVLQAFGSVTEGDEQTRSVKLVNRSGSALTFELVDPVHLGQGRLESRAITLHPRQPTTLQPRASCQVELKFAPLSRLEPFSEDLLIRYAGQERKLLTVTGRATGLDVSLEQDTLPFGAVCAGSLVTKPLVLDNSGDSVAIFKWDVGSFGPHFRVSPLEGRVLAGSDLTFTVTFQPKAVDEDLRAEGMKLMIDGAPPLDLTCLGSCVPQPEDSISELVFDGAVREATTQEVAVTNPTAKPWFLTPVLVGDHWRCANSLEVPPNGSTNFQVTYYPLTMTQGAAESPGASAEQQEAWAAARPPQLEGSLFFALPTGEALLYTLKGTSTAPLLASTIEVNAPAKALQAVTLPLANWLPNGAQRLNVAIAKNTDQSADASSSDVAASTSTFEGTPTVDLPAGGTYDYVLKCRAYVEGQCSATVTFTNPASGEYMSHVVTLSVQAPGSMGTLQLEAPLRTTARQLVTVDNPLPPAASITFAEGNRWWACADPCVRLTRVGAMAGNAEGTFSVEYRPLQCGSGGLAPLDSETELEFQIAELGTYMYLLKLRSLPAAAEPTLRFEAPLGGNQSDSFQFTSYARSAVTYACAVGQPAFFNVNGSVAAAASDSWEGVAAQVAVRFEPQALGDVQDVLTLTPSDGSAPLKVKLQGVARRPQPQGPFDIAPGGARDVPVRNVFASDAEYSFTVDHPAFSVGNVKATIKAKESANCNVKFTGTGSEVSAKLFVSCLAKPDIPPWVFYLRGKA